MANAMNKYGPVIQATLKGIEQADVGMSMELREQALLAVAEYATEHQYFHGGQPLAAWRERCPAGGAAHQDWRNRWGAVITAAKTAGYIKRVGRIRPDTRQSHTKSLSLWQSRLYKGEAQPEPQTSDYLEMLRDSIVLGETEPLAALWLAYDAGIENK